MPSFWIALVVGALVAVVVAGWVCLRAWRRTDIETKGLIKRITHLRFRNKLRLSVALVKDRRIPMRARLIPPAIVAYLAMPIDIIPDFIPVIGYMDDVIIMVVGVGLLLRLAPRAVLEEHIAFLEAR